MVLVGFNGTVPFGDCLVFANQNGLCHLIDETEIVRHQYDSTIKGIDCISQRVNTLESQGLSGKDWEEITKLSL